MGAEQFSITVLARTASGAFNKAVDDAHYWHGHGGYTGTIAEKEGYTYVGELPPRVTAVKFELALDFWSGPKVVQRWDEERNEYVTKKRPRKSYDRRPAAMTRGKYTEAWWDRVAELYNDKWGPAICVQLNRSETTRFRAQMNKKGSPLKAWFFCGWASS